MNQVHVVQNQTESWDVVVDGKDAPIDTFPTQEEAAHFARDFAQLNDMEFTLHNTDGEIRKKDSSGDVPDDPNATDKT